mmetsp:Transcript_10277/g.33975  ORF Transcript_10277/g.33975 Transcript_10277/m.33975 type:complete len:80 (+) Transcript_10277:440-679(+)
MVHGALPPGDGLGERREWRIRFAIVGVVGVAVRELVRQLFEVAAGMVERVWASRTSCANSTWAGRMPAFLSSGERNIGL